ncbi:MAG: ABC-2 family transporter protein [Lachnospiraceae bacterium]|nr:ABC-2 family transporter protein [Lachnospiraceae bacterium]
MRAYVEFAIKKFQNKMTYRLEFFMGILDTIISLIVYLCIYNALYGNEASVDGITLSMVATNFVISLGLSNAFHFDEFFLEKRVNEGSICNEFLKPVNFVFRMFSENAGEGLFKVIFNFIPAVIFAIFYTELCKPSGLLNVLLMLLSVVLGYIILWLISFIVQTWTFWFLSVWGIITIKNVFVNILSGSMIPIWFMPSALRRIIAFTPFESIYFTPVRIYLGELSGMDILKGMGIQILWILILMLIANLFWKKGVKKLVIQGG